MNLNRLIEFPLLTYSTARSVHYTIQYDLMNKVSHLIPGLKGAQMPDETSLKDIRQRVTTLLRADVQNALDGKYPLEVFLPESPVKHVKRLARILIDGVSLSRRRYSQSARNFSSKAQDYLDDVPEYYKRCFHFQTDGYLSDWSADLYEHQVELLFGGTADPMRRLLIPPMKEFFEGNPDGAGLTFLEFGAGTGRATRNVRLAFPKARIVATDLSEPYLRHARERLGHHSRLDFVRADAAELPFADEKFDAVYSVFTLHETPLDARKSILKEAHRVLKKGGYLGLVDSAQLGDIPEIDDVFKSFPANFHEPFYTNYIKTPLEKLLKAQKFKSIESEVGLFSKVTSAKK